MLTVKDVKEMFAGQYDDIEVYKPFEKGKYYPKYFRTGNCKFTEDYSDESEVGLYQLMNEDDYDHSILANASVKADFGMWYDDKNAKVLCIMLA